MKDDDEVGSTVLLSGTTALHMSSYYHSIMVRLARATMVQKPQRLLGLAP